MSRGLTSRLPAFYRLSLHDRRELLRRHAGLSDPEFATLDTGGLDLDTADHMIENVIGTYALPMGVALNFVIDDRDVLVPMVVEEASVVAAASNAARMLRAGGGFRAQLDPPHMIAQVQLTDVADPDAAALALHHAAPALLARAAEILPRLCDRGGGPRALETRVLSRPGSSDGGQLVVHLVVDCRDAMGANLVNTLAEALAPELAALAGPGARVGLRILTNLADRRLVRVSARAPFSALADADDPDGAQVATAIAQASRFAELDPYRAATHNKGIMNGVDAVLLATGNDWRSVEAGAHAFAAASGRYAPLATWRVDGDALHGQLAMPMAVGTVGGALHAHRGARLALALCGADTAEKLGAVVGAAGLASNLAALRALATAGIQKGHMALHARAVARAAGADGALVDQVAAELAASGDVKPERARAILTRLLASSNPEVRK